MSAHASTLHIIPTTSNNSEDSNLRKFIFFNSHPPATASLVGLEITALYKAFVMTAPGPPLSAYTISPVNPSSTTDISQVVAMLNATFDGESSRFQRAYYAEPYPAKEERETSYSRRLIDGLTNKGKKGWQVKLEDEVVGVMIWQPPGVGYHLFDTNTSGSDSRETTVSKDQTGSGELYEYIDPVGWNSLYGKMQAARDKVHEGRPGCW